MHATHVLRQGLVVHGGVGLHHVVLRRAHRWQQRLKQTMPNILLYETRSITSVGGTFSISLGLLGNLSIKLISPLYFNFPSMPRATLASKQNQWISTIKQHDSNELINNPNFKQVVAGKEGVECVLVYERWVEGEETESGVGRKEKESKK